MECARLWYFQIRNYAYALGPIEAPSKEEAQRRIKKMGYRPVDVWETTRHEMDKIQAERERMKRELGANAWTLWDI